MSRSPCPCRPAAFLTAAAILWAAAPARAGDDPPGVQPDTLYVVAVSHLDTQWLWDIVTTVREYIPATFRDSMDQLDRHPGYRFGLEGANRYRLLREYHPDLWQRLQAYVADGRWSPSGSALEGGDVNIPSPESLVRQFLYGNGFFRRAFGRASVDVFLPDCFGFGWALPSVAAHCGLKGFSTQKLRAWGSAAGVPFDVGRWRGPDGAEIVAALDPGNYAKGIAEDLSRSPSWTEALDRQQAASGLRFGYHYFGVGDRGGGMPEASLDLLDAALASDGPLRVRSVASDQPFRDLDPGQIAALPVHDGELLLSTHGTGAYTSQCAMKRWNRRNEQLGDAAERAAVLAAAVAGRPYPRDWLADAWERFLVHQFHDDLTGTGIPEVYPWSWNDLRLAQLRFATALQHAVGAVAASLDTRAEGVPLVVYNALSEEREDLVEAWVRFPDAVPAHVRVFGPDGAEVPAQAAGVREGAVQVVFLARVPAVGMAVYDARPSEVPCGLATGLSASPAGLENGRYRVTLDEGGDVAGILDKATGREVLAGPVRLAQFSDVSLLYPAWEIPWFNLAEGPREHVEGPFEAVVTEAGPARVTVEVRRRHASWEFGGESAYVLRVRLAAGEAGDVVEWDAGIDWATRMTLLKVEFPLAAGAATATWDLGLGAIERGNAHALLYEVPGQQWADVTPPGADHGTSILSLDKVGWHKPDDGTLYLTLIHTPMLPDFHHDTNDIGRHRTGWALRAHDGDWRRGTPARARRYNQPLLAFQAPPREGPLGRSTGFLSVSDPAVTVQALKGAEASDEVVVRLVETTGTARAAVRLALGRPVLAAREVFGDEEPRGPARVVDGALEADLGPFQPRSFALTLAKDRRAAPLEARSEPLDLPLDADVVSPHDDPADGAFGAGGSAFPAEQWPETLQVGGATFRLGPAGKGQANALECRGQSLPLGPEPLAAGERLHLLLAAEGDVEATFRAGDGSATVRVQDSGGFVGQWDSRVVDGGVVEDPVPAVRGYLKPAEVAWYGTHRHGAGGDEVYRFAYLFRHVLDLPAGAGTLVLPDDPRVKVFAATRVVDPADGTVPASEVFDDFDPLARPLAGWTPPASPPEPVPDRAEEAPGGDAGDLPGPGPDGDDGPDAAGEEGPGSPDVPDVGREDAAPDGTTPDAAGPGDDAGAEAAPEGGTDPAGGGGCSAGTPGAAGPWLPLLALALALRRRRGR